MNRDSYPKIDQASRFTDEKLKQLRSAIEQALAQSKYRDAITVVTTGSYGRGEATDESDLDWFIIFDRDQAAEEIKEEIEAIAKVVAAHIEKDTGDTGTFGQDAIVRFSDMQCNIGGQDDTNETLTRRLLFLLEGTWLYGPSNFNNYRRQLLEKYIKPSSPDEQIPRFLLNDIIRYYRTIATDFEFKTAERQKSWGLRNIKLRFSRKLLYFSGIIVTAELHGLEWEKKLETALKLFDQPALTRIECLSHEHVSAQMIFSTYESFIEQLGQPGVRYPPCANNPVMLPMYGLGARMKELR